MSCPTGMAAAGTSGRLFSFGIISDVQYADIPDGRSFKGVARFYRAALPALRRAVLTWRARDVDFGMHFGAPPGASAETCRVMPDAIAWSFASSSSSRTSPHWSPSCRYVSRRSPGSVIGIRQMDGELCMGMFALLFCHYPHAGQPQI